MITTPYWAEDTITNRFIGWTIGDGSSNAGYNVHDYFEHGCYLGPDHHGIEPIFEAPAIAEAEAEGGAQ
jgi:hypothetical protein